MKTESFVVKFVFLANAINLAFLKFLKAFNGYASTLLIWSECFMNL